MIDRQEDKKIDRDIARSPSFTISLFIYFVYLE